MKDEQPVDYEVPTFEEVLEREYKALSFFGKVIYHLQDYVVLAVTLSGVAGYAAGATFGWF